MQDVITGFLLIHALLWVLYAIRGSQLVDYLNHRTRIPGWAQGLSLLVAISSGILAALTSL